MTAAAKAHSAGEDARTVYQGRIQELRLEEGRLEREHRRLGYVRLVFGLAVVILLLPPIPPVVLPILGFALAARFHGQILARLAEVRRLLTFFEHGLARLEDRWTGLRPRETPSSAKDSLFAADLDLFGAGSVFELICEARTSLGEATLSTWLLQGAPMGEIRERQKAVQDLGQRLSLREAFAAAAGPERAYIDTTSLASWLENSGMRVPEIFRWLAPLLVVLVLLATVRYAVAQRPTLLSLVLLVEVSLTFQYRHVFREIFVQSEKSGRALRTMQALFAALEQESLEAPLLRELQETLKGSDASASQAMAQLARQLTWAEARGNYVVRLLDAPFLYSLQWALALQRWRDRFGPSLMVWLQTLGECEALLSLAGYSFEHPGDVFPELCEGPAMLEASGLGHVLLPEQRCVRNDVVLGHGTQLLLVSGSNMSGKSTLLRSVGVSAVLSFAGAPVRAHALRLSPLTIAASIQVNDSLQGGRSRFYSEILRLREIVEAARKQAPALFLIDEVLAGTNSSDRAAGAQGLLRELLRAQAVGLLSTHDLALTKFTDAHEDVVRNVHFQDEVVEGKLQFPYKLQDGVVQRSNGLALMRMIGLDV